MYTISMEYLRPKDRVTYLLENVPSHAEQKKGGVGGGVDNIEHPCWVNLAGTLLLYLSVAISSL